MLGIFIGPIIKVPVSYSLNINLRGVDMGANTEETERRDREGETGF
jgi:hypothetical protein